MTTDLGGEMIDAMMGAGRVSATTVRLWLRSPSGDRRIVRVSSATGSGHGVAVAIDPPDAAADHTLAMDWPRDAADAPSLRPDTDYRASLETLDGDVEAECVFRTLPDENERGVDVRIAFMSCHQPFRDDASLDPKSVAMLEATAACLRERRPHLVLMIGDQMYADAPGATSLFAEGAEELLAKEPAEIRSLLHRRYRAFWGVPGWRSILSGFPCLPILDDHDIVDNFGASEVHLSSGWARYREGAFAAYRDYQGSRAAASVGDEGPFCFDSRCGRTAVFVADVRSRRRREPEHPLLGAEQKERLDRFLRASEDLDAVVVVFSVPLVHVPNTVAAIGSLVVPGADEFSDRCDAPHFLRDRDWVLRRLREHQVRRPDQPLVVVGGDIHVGAVSRVDWRDSPGGFHHVISSSISHRPGTFFRHLSAVSVSHEWPVSAADGETLADVRLIGAAADEQNPFPGLNLGFVTIESGRDGKSRPRIELIGDKEGELEVVLSNATAES